MDQASGLKLLRREEISSNIFLFFNYGKKSGFYYGILLDFEGIPIKTEYIWNCYGINWVQIDAPRRFLSSYSEKL